MLIGYSLTCTEGTLDSTTTFTHGHCAAFKSVKDGLLSTYNIFKYSNLELTSATC